MKKKVKDLEASIRGQLQNKAKGTDRPFSAGWKAPGPWKLPY